MSEEISENPSAEMAAQSDAEGSITSAAKSKKDYVHILAQPDH